MCDVEWQRRQSGKNESHWFPPSLIILSLKFLLNLKRGPETIQTLIHVRVNASLIMVYAHRTDRRAINVTSCSAATIVVCHYTCILHLSSFKEHAFQKKGQHQRIHCGFRGSLAWQPDPKVEGGTLYPSMNAILVTQWKWRNGVSALANVILPTGDRCGVCLLHV